MTLFCSNVRYCVCVCLEGLKKSTNAFGQDITFPVVTLLSNWKWVPGISPGVKAAGAYGWRPSTLVVPNVKKIRGLNLPETLRLLPLPSVHSPRIPVQCSSLNHSSFVLLLWCAGQYMDLHSFHLCPAPIIVSLNTSIECYCRMWLSKQSSIKENILVWFWRRAFLLDIEFKITPNFEMCLVCKYLKFMSENHILE
jgi:hypothetical protein